MKKLLLKSIIIVFPIFIILVSVNYFGDAAKLFDDSYEKKMAEIIHSGSNVTNIQNFDVRRFQKEVVKRMKECPDVLVIGSSRTMAITKECDTSGTFFNNSVFGASIEDLIAVYQLYKLKGMHPKKIILGIDPWIFNENNEQKRWKSLSSEYHSFFGEKDVESNNLANYSELISPSYFQSSLNSLFRANTLPVATSDIVNDISTTILTDGSTVESKLTRELPLETINSKIDDYISSTVFGLGNYSAISPGILKEFKLFIKELLKQNIEVSFFLSPYPYKVYKELKSKYPQSIEVEKIIREFANRNGIKIYGSYNSELLDLDNSYFYDGMHCQDNAIKKIFQLKN